MPFNLFVEIISVIFVWLLIVKRLDDPSRSNSQYNVHVTSGTKIIRWRLMTLHNVSLSAHATDSVCMHYGMKPLMGKCERSNDILEVPYSCMNIQTTYSYTQSTCRNFSWSVVFSLFEFVSILREMNCLDYFCFTEEEHHPQKKKKYHISWTTYKSSPLIIGLSYGVNHNPPL